VQKHRRRASTYPDRHPFGWYHLLDSDDLRPGKVVPVEALGQEFAVFRSASGSPHAVAAYCPHLGANLAAGGRVVDDCIECPFHGWRFRGDGTLARVPYASRPPRVRTKSWPVREHYRMIFVYTGPLGANAEVPYEPSCWPELETGRLSYRGRYAPRDIRMHLLEFAENGVDMQHFGRLHGALRVPWTQLRVPFVEVRHETRWEADPERPHVAHFFDDAQLAVFGRDLPSTAARAHVMFLGPGSLVLFRIAVPSQGEVLVLQTHTPVDGPDDPLLLRVRFRFWAERTVPRPLSWYIAGNWISQWWQDVAIWENKIHVARPPLAREDGAVHSLRSWFSQFYAREGSQITAPADRSSDRGRAPSRA